MSYFKARNDDKLAPIPAVVFDVHNQPIFIQRDFIDHLMRWDKMTGHFKYPSFQPFKFMEHMP